MSESTWQDVVDRMRKVNDTISGSNVRLSVSNTDKALDTIRAANRLLAAKDARLERLEKVNFGLWVAVGALLSYIIMGWL